VRQTGPKTHFWREITKNGEPSPIFPGEGKNGGASPKAQSQSTRYVETFVRDGFLIKNFCFEKSSDL
jgi:hypothetical protein